MAAAEARPVLQRAANRYFVQEDAKRAPKLASCQSSSSSSSKQADSSPTSAANVNDHPSVGFMPLNRNPSYSSLPPDMTHIRWWLQMESSYGPEKGIADEKLHALENEVDSLKGEINSPSKLSEVNLQDAQSDSGNDNKRNNWCSLDSTDLLKSYEILEMESVDCSVSRKTSDFCFDDFESSLVEGRKAVPWWRTADKDELFSLVAQKSSDLIENCDLPPPQKMHVWRYSHACSNSFNSDELSSLAQKSEACSIPSPIVNAPALPDSVRSQGGPMSSDEQEKMQCVSDSTTQKETTGQVSNSDKAKLLEALRYSQTRAREAENAAKQAHAEKEHLIKLIFKQASQLFAYKQWFKLLQLESLYLQIKNNEQPISSIFPIALPWIPNNSKKSSKSSQKFGKSKQGKGGQSRPDITMYAAFALGMTLVGGLLFGWTAGWMF